MTYARTTWVDNTTLVDAAKMNNIETELALLDAQLAKEAGALSATPPGSPVDGQFWFFPADAVGTIWQFRYNASSGSAYKWEFVGGSALQAGPQGSTSGYTGTTWNELISGPRINVPRAGDYLLQHGCSVGNLGSAWTGSYGFLVDAPLSVAGNGPAQLLWNLSSAWSGNYASMINKRTNVATGQYFYIAGQTDRAGQNTTFNSGWLSLLPIRVS